MFVFMCDFKIIVKKLITSHMEIREGVLELACSHTLWGLCVQAWSFCQYYIELSVTPWPIDFTPGNLCREIIQKNITNKTIVCTDMLLVASETP